MPRSQYLKRVKTIVVKVGSSLITDSNGISAECVDKLVDDVVFLIKKNICLFKDQREKIENL